MYKLIKKSDHCHGEITDVVALPYDLRQRGRFKAQSVQGHELGVFLSRAEVLREGDYLLSECGKTFLVAAEQETLTVARATNWPDFAKACYHLGNRDVPLQIGELWLSFHPDHVLAEMVALFGLTTTEEQAGFNPENGAYAGGGHKHGHHSHGDHSHSHEHAH